VRAAPQAGRDGPDPDPTEVCVVLAKTVHAKAVMSHLLE